MGVTDRCDGFVASKDALHSTHECISETRERGSRMFVGEQADSKKENLGQKHEHRNINVEIPLTL